MRRVFLQKLTMSKWITKHTNVLLLTITLCAAVLRFVALDLYPPALYSDEVDQAYNAYSILKTGRDEHGVLFPVSFRSFGDWKPPVQTYLMVPSVWMFGLNAWGTRIPSALLGTLTIPLLFFIIKQLQNSTEDTDIPIDHIGLLSAFFLAISPWHIHHSRMAMLTAIALFFLAGGMYSMLKSFKKPEWLVVSSVSFALCIYSYYGMRLIVPLFCVSLVILFWRQIAWKSKSLLVALCVGFILLVPLGVQFFKNPDVVFGRAKTVSVFYDQGVYLTLWERITKEGPLNPQIARFFHNKPMMYGVDILRRFLSHFVGHFLFLVGDTHLPFQIPNMGVLYLFDALLVPVGILYALKRKKVFSRLFILWMLISIVPAALTFLTPAANRSFTASLPFAVFSAFGLLVLLKKFSWSTQKIVYGFATLCIVSGMSYFIYQYTVVLPYTHADWLLYGNKELIHYIGEHESEYEEIVVSGKLSVFYIYVLFFNAVDPQIAQSGVFRDLKPDRFGFEHAARFEKYWFPREFSWEKEVSKLSDRSLLVTTPTEVVGSEAQKIHTIYYPNQTEAYVLYQIKKTE